MMQHVLSSDTLMAVAALLAGSVLLGTIVRPAFRFVLATARKRSRTAPEYLEDKAA